MSGWFDTDWSKVFAPQMSIPEVLVRGTLGYLGVVILLRIVPRRAAGRISLSDLLVVTIIAGVVRNPLVGSSDSVLDGFLIIAVVLLWSFALDWLSYRVEWVHRLLHPNSVVVVRNGRVQDENLAGELMTREQLKAQLRQHGISNLAEVAEARIESDGKVSVIARRTASSQHKTTRHS
ncbi:MAG TPA: YetF domain-containing protein [Gemmataceae bacterium]|jgi:uncharacterized membrane protein YcaP (DUF421 family)|nr:YetF domain-containing protein [Gemmataceae bacterium]